MSINPTEFTEALAKRGMLKMPVHCPECLKPDVIQDNGIFWQCSACGWAFDVIERKRVESETQDNGESDMSESNTDRNVKRIPLDLSEEQYEAFLKLHKMGVYDVRGSDGERNYEFDNRNSYLRHLIAKDYEDRIGEPFPDDPQVGGYRPKK